MLTENRQDARAIRTGALYKFTLPRNDLKVVEMGATINVRMGLGDRPMIIFLHCWGTGSAEKLATGFNAAVNELGTHGASTR